jgi:hypothetical protein
MARQRASQARDAFARVGTAPVGPADDASAPAGFTAGIPASGNDSISAVVPDGSKAVYKVSGKVGGRASGKTGRKAGKTARRVGRPRGPERVALTTRILAATDRRLTAAVEQTGESPQYIVDAALAAYLDALGIG